MSDRPRSEEVMENSKVFLARVVAAATASWPARKDAIDVERRAAGGAHIMHCIPMAMASSLHAQALCPLVAANSFQSLSTPCGRCVGVHFTGSPSCRARPTLRRVCAQATDPAVAASAVALSPAPRSASRPAFDIWPGVSQHDLERAAWLRAEAYYENRSVGRFKASFVKQFAGQELYALLRRTKGPEPICVTLVATKAGASSPAAAAAAAAAATAGPGNCLGTLDVRLLNEAVAASIRTFGGSWPEGVPQPSECGGAAAAYVSNVVVAAAQRGRGLGRQLVSAATELAQERWQAVHVYCHVEIDNEASTLLRWRYTMLAASGSWVWSYLPRKTARRPGCNLNPRQHRSRSQRALRRAAKVLAAATVAASQPADASAATPAAPRPQQPVVKVCGVTSAEDATVAAQAGANLIGMILWPKAKRSIPAAVARQVAAAARAHGAEPVGVFVDEDAATIASMCEESDVLIAQLHGDGARAALPALPTHLSVIWVLHADKAGRVQTALPPSPSSSSNGRQPRWIIVDSLQGGSGEAFDWQQLRESAAASLEPLSSHGWLLAGGLTPDCVAEAIATAGPTGVDVSSGVCGPDGLKKDGGKVQRYCSAARAEFGRRAAAAGAPAEQI
ncbi:N-(5'-phosphoribosyl)anthranilate isomerase 1 [Chlorella vulgaris]